ncbi:MAG: hypothetical protein ACRD1O_00495, partial [Terriglobia bacterium]
REQATAQLKQQRFVAHLSNERLEADRLIGSVIAQLRELLDGRAELSAKMRAAADAIDLRADLDEGRFVSLLASLPEDVAQASESWHRRFTGAERGKEYVVTTDTLTLEETLADCGLYKRGSVLKLSDERASELLAKDAVDYLEGNVIAQLRELLEEGAQQEEAAATAVL